MDSKKNIQHAGSAANEHAQEVNQKAQYEVNKNIAMTPNLPMGDRAQGAVDAVGNKMSEKTHEVKKAYHQTQAGLTSDVVTGQGLQSPSTAESNIKHTGSAAIEHAQEIDQRAQFELNKNIAMTPNLPIGDRAQGAVGAVGNKMSEKAHEVKKAYHQTQAGLTSDVVTGEGKKESPLTIGTSNIQHAGSAANEHAQEINQRAQFELNKNIAMTPNLPMGERAQGAVGAVGSKMSEKAHEAKKAYHQTQAGLTSDVVTGQGKTAGTSNVQHAGSAANEHAQEINQRAQFELNKNIAMTPNLPIGERAQGAVGAVGNKMSEKAHEAKKAYHQTQAGLTSDVVTGQGKKDYASTGASNIEHAGSAAIEHAQEIDQRAQFELNKNIVMTPNIPIGDRAQGAVGAVGNKMSEKAHEVKKAYHQTQAGLTSDVVTGQGKSAGTSNIEHAGSAAIEHAQEIDQRAQFELNKNIAMNPNLPIGERAQGTVGAVGNKMSEKTHEVKKAYHQTQAGLTSDVVTGQGSQYPSTGESKIKHAGSAAIEHAQEIDQKAQFELNKNNAMTPNLPMGERAQGAVGAVGNKISEKTHEVKKAYHQTQAGLTSDVVTGQGLQESPSDVQEHKSTTVDSTIRLAGIAATEHSKEIDQKQQYEENLNIAMNPILPVLERAQYAVGAVGSLVSEKAHEATKVLHQGLSGLTTSISTPFTTTTTTPITPEHKVDIKQAGIAAQEHSIEIDQKARFEENKNFAMTPDIPVGERAQAAVEAVANLMNEKLHEANKVFYRTISGLAPDVITAEGQKEEQPTITSPIQHAGIAATEHSLEMDQKAQYELHKNLAMNTNLPVGDRTQAAVEAVGNLMSEKTHKANKAYHQTQAGLTDIKTGEGQRELIPTASEKIKHAGMAATEHALEINQKEQFEENKNIALDEELTMVERTVGAVGAVGNKVGELSHEVSKKYHQNLAGVEADVKTATVPNTFGLIYGSETEEKHAPKRDIKQAGWAAKEHAQEIDQKIQYKENKQIAMNPDIPISDRSQAAVDAVGNKLSEQKHAASKVYYQTLSGLGTQDHTPVPEKPVIISPLEKMKHVVLAATEHSQEIHQKAEFEQKKNIALNPELPLVDRAQAALGAVGNKISAKTHKLNKAYHQSLAGLTPEVETSDLPIATQIQKQKSTKLEKIKHVGLAATEHSQEVDQKEQFEINKTLALDTNLPLGDRTTAAFDALGNLISEKFHGSNKLYHRNLAGLKSDSVHQNLAGLKSDSVHQDLAELKLEGEEKQHLVSSPPKIVPAPGPIAAEPALNLDLVSAPGPIAVEPALNLDLVSAPGPIVAQPALNTDHKESCIVVTTTTTTTSVIKISDPDKFSGEMAQAAIAAVGKSISQKTQEVHNSKLTELVE